MGQIGPVVQEKAQKKRNFSLRWKRSIGYHCTYSKMATGSWHGCFSSYADFLIDNMEYTFKFIYE